MLYIMQFTSFVMRIEITDDFIYYLHDVSIKFHAERQKSTYKQLLIAHFRKYQALFSFVASLSISFFCSLFKKVPNYKSPIVWLFLLSSLLPMEVSFVYLLKTFKLTLLMVHCAIWCIRYFDSSFENFFLPL